MKIVRLHEKKVFCILLMLEPVLRLYGIGIGGTFGDYALIIIAACIAIKRDDFFVLKNSRDYIELAPFMFYLLANFLITYHEDISFSNQFIDWIRVFFIYFIFVTGIKKYFDFEIAYKCYALFSIMATLLLIIQYVFSISAGIYISGKFTPLYLGDSLKEVDNFKLYGVTFFRPSSFFQEPAHYATYVLGYFALLCTRKINTQRIFIMAFIAMGILLSGSTTGLIVLVFIVIVWIAIYLHNIKKLRYYILLVLIVGVALYYVSQTDSFIYMISRITSNSGSSISSTAAFRSRFLWLNNLKLFDSPIRFLFGTGTCSDVLSEWVPGWILFLNSFGVVGLIFYLGAFIYLFVNSSKEGKILFLIFWGLGAGTEVIVDQNMFLYLPYAMIAKNIRYRDR